MDDRYRLRFGKHKGEPLDEVPLDYLIWLRDKVLREPLATLLPLEIQGRLEARRPPPPPPPRGTIPKELRDAAARLISAGLRAEAKKAHPDCGGTNEEMTRLNRAAEALRGIVRR